MIVLCVLGCVRSIEIMEPLVKQRQHPVWLFWKELIALTTYACRHSYDAEEGPKEFDRLANNMLAAYDKVEGWGDDYGKPKLHPAVHLGQSLKENGPPRTYWCYPFEAYLQVLKRVFDMASYKSAAYRVGLFWAVNSVRNYRDPHRSSWHEDVIDVAGAWQDLGATPFHTALASQAGAACRIRCLRSVSRSRERISAGDWVLAQDQGVSVIGCIADMVQVLLPAPIPENTPQSVVRMWLDGCSEPRVGQSSELWAPTPDMSRCMLLHYESTHLTKVNRQPHPGYDVYLM